MKLPTKSGKLKDLILEILGKEFPLSAKEIFQRVTREHGRDVTYQAVHKSILEAIGEGALVKSGAKYQLDKAWIKQLKDYSRELEQSYSGQEDYYARLKKVDKGPVQLTFNDLTIFATTLATIFSERLLTKGKPARLRAWVAHAYWPLRFNFSDFHLLAKISASNPFGRALVCNDTPFDQWVTQQYITAGKPYGGYAIIDTKFKTKEDNFALDDYVVRISFSPETKEFLRQAYSEIHGLYDLLKFYYSDKIGTFKPEIHCIIEHNPTLADFIAEKVDSVYSKDENYLKYIKELKKTKE